MAQPGTSLYLSHSLLSLSVGHFYRGGVFWKLLMTRYTSVSGLPFAVLIVVVAVPQGVGRLEPPFSHQAPGGQCSATAGCQLEGPNPTSPLHKVQ